MTQPRKRMRRIGVLFAVTALLALAGAASAQADTVTDWNTNATNTLIGTAGQGPTVAALHLAMVHGAVYDAVNAIDGGYDPYLTAPAAMPWYSKDAAAATAAYRVLSNLVPLQQGTLDGLYAASLAGIPDGPAKAGGVTVGEAAATAMLTARADDGRLVPFSFPVGSEPGEWRPVLPAFANDPFARLARIRPFMTTTPSQFRSDGPNPITSPEYASEFAEVKALGRQTGSTRTADQTDMARFWAEHPPAMWSRIFRQLSAGHGLTVAENARYFAMLYLTGADSLISCWDDKAHWLYWRPITAIREANTDGNAATSADPAWLPLIPTPPYPEHPSGHACLSSSFVRTLRDFFGTNQAEFSALSGFSGTTRSFSRFSEAIHEIIDARVYSGIHFRIADVQGAVIGKKVANWREKHFFQPASR
jgi:hypothetical protein